MRDDPGATLSFDLSRPGRIGCTLPPLDVPEAALPPKELLRDELSLPELSQLDVVRYFTRLSQRNYSIDTGFYPLGSCSMKYNPRINEDAARLPGLLIARAYHQANGNGRRTRVLVPDSAHGTNPATAAMAGFAVESIPSGRDGNLDMAALEQALDRGDGVAALMLTLPSTLGP